MKNGKPTTRSDKPTTWRERVAECAQYVLLALYNGAEFVNNHLPPRTLYEAAGRGDMRRLRAFLDRGVAPNAAGPYGGRSLVVAAAQGRLEAVVELLRRGALVDETTAPPDGPDGRMIVRFLSGGRSTSV